MSKDDELDKMGIGGILKWLQIKSFEAGKLGVDRKHGANREEAKQAIKANYRHIDDIRGAIDADLHITQEFEKSISDKLTPTDMVKVVALVSSNIRQALNIGDSDDTNAI